jgi:hypothetical protein
MTIKIIIASVTCYKSFSDIRKKKCLNLGQNCFPNLSLISIERDILNEIKTGTVGTK